MDSRMNGWIVEGLELWNFDWLAFSMDDGWLGGWVRLSKAEHNSDGDDGSFSWRCFHQQQQKQLNIIKSKQSK